MGSGWDEEDVGGEMCEGGHGQCGEGWLLAIVVPHMRHHHGNDDKIDRDLPPLPPHFPAVLHQPPSISKPTSIYSICSDSQT